MQKTYNFSSSSRSAIFIFQMLFMIVIPTQNILKQYRGAYNSGPRDCCVALNNNNNNVGFLKMGVVGVAHPVNWYFWAGPSFSHAAPANALLVFALAGCLVLHTRYAAAGRFYYLRRKVVFDSRPGLNFTNHLQNVQNVLGRISKHVKHLVSYSFSIYLVPNWGASSFPAWLKIPLQFCFTNICTACNYAQLCHSYCSLEHLCQTLCTQKRLKKFQHKSCS